MFSGVSSKGGRCSAALPWTLSMSRPAFRARPVPRETRRRQALAGRRDAATRVVASKLDRMFRSASDCLAVVEAFKARGVSLFLLDLNGGADDVSGNGIARLFLTIVSAFAEFERNRIGERIRATKQRQKANGEFSGAVPFGFMVDANRRLVPLKAQQAAIRRMHALRRKGLSLRAISAELAKSGIKISHVSVGRCWANNRRDG